MKGANAPRQQLASAIYAGPAQQPRYRMSYTSEWFCSIFLLKIQELVCFVLHIGWTGLQIRLPTKMKMLLLDIEDVS